MGRRCLGLQSYSLMEVELSSRAPGRRDEGAGSERFWLVMSVINDYVDQFLREETRHTDVEVGPLCWRIYMSGAQCGTLHTFFNPLCTSYLILPNGSEESSPLRLLWRRRSCASALSEGRGLPTESDTPPSVSLLPCTSGAESSQSFCEL